MASQLTLKPSWPGGKYCKTVSKGKGKTRLEFKAGEVTKVTDIQRGELERWIGSVLFDCEVDAKGRIRCVELGLADETETPADATANMETVPDDDNQNV